MKQNLLPRLCFCALVGLSVASTAFADVRGHHSSSRPGFARRSVARSNGGSRFNSVAPSHSNNVGNFRGFNSLHHNGVRWNSGAYRYGSGLRNGAARWNGNRGRAWAFNRYHNRNWNHRGRGNQVIFIGGYGYCPWYFPYFEPSYGSYYPYRYGAYQASYEYDSDNAYGQPVYDGNNVDQNYAPPDDNGSYYQQDSSNGEGSVASVQRLLARAGFYQGSIDGAMGSRTYYAIRAYQRSHHLPVDGQIGPELLRSLGRS